MLFVVKFIYVFNHQAEPNTLLEAAYTDAAIDERRPPLRVQAFPKFSGDLLKRATQIVRKRARDSLDFNFYYSSCQEER